MNDSRAITAENLLASLPRVLAEDDSMRALAAAAADVLSGRVEEIAGLSIYPRVEDLPEELLDILAYDFKVDWWDYSFSLQEKRETLKSSWYVHKHMGTPAAVKTALAAIYPDTVLEEWFQYNGLPYHFRLKIPIDARSDDPVKHAIVIGLVRFYKNLRSVLDSVEYTGAAGTATAYQSVAAIGVEITVGSYAGVPYTEYLLDESYNLLLDELNAKLID